MKMSRLTSFACCLAPLLVTPTFASAEAVFSTARTLPSSTLMLGFEPEVTPVEGPAYDLFLHGGFGMTRATDFQMRLGVPLYPGGGPLYLGADVQINLLHDGAGAPGISLTTGAHARGSSSFGLDGTLIVSNRFGKLEPFAAFDFDGEFRGNTIDPEMHLVGGMMVCIAKPTDILFELGLGLDGAPTYVSMGARFLF